MPFPAWHRKHPSGVECCLSSVVVLQGVIIAFVTAGAVLNAAIISEASRRTAEGDGRGRNVIHSLRCCGSFGIGLVKWTISEEFIM